MCLCSLLFFFFFFPFLCDLRLRLTVQEPLQATALYFLFPVVLWMYRCKTCIVLVSWIHPFCLGHLNVKLTLITSLYLWGAWNSCLCFLFAEQAYYRNKTNANLGPKSFFFRSLKVGMHMSCFTSPLCVTKLTVKLWIKSLWMLFRKKLVSCWKMLLVKLMSYLALDYSTVFLIQHRKDNDFIL